MLLTTSFLFAVLNFHFWTSVMIFLIFIVRISSELLLSLLSLLSLLLLLLLSLLLSLLQCFYLYIYYLQRHVQSIVKCFNWESAKYVNGLWLLAIFAKPLSGMLDWVLNMLLIYLFVLSYFIYLLITLSIIHLTFLFINLCLRLKSVYTGSFSLLFPWVDMFYHFCLRICIWRFL